MIEKGKGNSGKGSPPNIQVLEAEDRSVNIRKNLYTPYLSLPPILGINNNNGNKDGILARAGPCRLPRHGR
jgi:hypothetical protein